MHVLRDASSAQDEDAAFADIPVDETQVGVTPPSHDADEDLSLGHLLVSCVQDQCVEVWAVGDLLRPDHRDGTTSRVQQPTVTLAMTPRPAAELTALTGPIGGRYVMVGTEDGHIHALW
jgi:hypothetical protein